MANRTVAVSLKAEVGQYVAGMSKAAAATMSVGEAAQKTESTSSKSFDIAGKGALVMGGAIVAGLGMAVSKAADFESSMSAVGAATQATAGTLGDLRDAAMKAGAQTQYSATEAADAITEMAKAGVSAKDIMGGGLKGALSLAAAGQIDVADAAGIASVAMTQFSLSGKDLPHVADLLAAGAGKAMGSVDDLGQALNQAGLVASAAGMGIEETTGTLSAFASAGLIGSDAGTSFKTMLQMLQGPSAKSSELMAQLGLDLYDTNGNMLSMSEIAGQLQTHLGGLTDEQRNSAMATIFGSDAVRAANVLYSEGASGITEWTNKVNDAGYAQEQAAALTDNLKGDLERLGGSFETLMISLGSGAQGPLREIVQMFGGLLDGVTGLVGIIGELPTPVVAIAAAFGAWAVAGDTVMSKLAPLKENVGGVFSSFGEALGYAKENGDGLKDVLGSVGEVALDSAKGGLKALAKAVGPELGMAVASMALSGVIDSITSVDEAANAATAAIKELVDPVKNATSNTERFDAQEKAIEGLRSQAEAAQKELESYESRSTLEKIWNFGDIDDPGGDLQVAVDKTTAALETQQKAADETERSLSVLAGRYHISRDDVLAFADAHGVNLAGSMQIAQTEFIRIAESTGAFKDVLADVPGIADSTSTSIAFIGEAADLTQDQVDEAVKALQDWRDELQKVGASFVEPLGVYKGLLEDKTAAEKESAQATADATDDASDSWEDYVGDVSVSLDELATKLEAQIANQENWRANLVTVTQRGGLEVGQALAAMGAEGADLTAAMATATTEDFDRMRDALVTDAQLGGADAAAALDAGMRVMAEVGAEGADATVAAVAEKLHLGIDQVAAIAAEYGVTLASGINPILVSLGKSPVRNGQRVPDFYDGGFTGEGGKYTPAGIVHKGEFVMPQEAVSRIGVSNLGALAGLPGYANGGYVSAADVPRPSSTAPFGMPLSTAGDATMSKEYDEVTAWMAANAGPAAGSGSGMSGTWTSIAGIVQRAIPQARINSTYRPGDPGYHGKNKAVDFGFGSGPGGNGSAGLASIAAFLYGGYGRSLAEIIYDGIGDNTPDVKNGADHVYNAATRAEHRNHVHAAVYHRGTDFVPQTGFAYLEKGEAVIPASVNARSREFSGGFGGSLGGSVSKTDARSYPLTIQAGPGVGQIVRATRDAQRDMEFLHG